MIIDAHTHIFPPAVVQNRAAYFTDEPEFAAMYADPKAKLAAAGDLLDMLERNGVDKAVACGFPWRSAENFRRHNDYLAETQAKHGRRIACLGAFHPMCPPAVDETRRCLEMGLQGLGELAFYREPIDDAALELMEPVMALCAKAGRPVLLHANEPVGHQYPGKAPAGLAEYYEFCRRFPQNKIILAHWGGGLVFYLTLKREAKQVLQNVWFDSAALPFLYDDNIYDITISISGPEKLLFGSDFPLLEPARYLKTIAQNGLSAAAQGALLGGNIKKLFNFSTN